MWESPNIYLLIPFVGSLLGYSLRDEHWEKPLLLIAICTVLDGMCFLLNGSEAGALPDPGPYVLALSCAVTSVSVGYLGRSIFTSPFALTQRCIAGVVGHFDELTLMIIGTIGIVAGIILVILVRYMIGAETSRALPALMVAALVSIAVGFGTVLYATQRGSKRSR